MLDNEYVPQIDSDEIVSRFVLQSAWFRSTDMTVKQDAFLPHRTRFDLSVMRHRSATAEELWAAGNSVASVSSRTLYGRAELSVSVCRAKDLEAIATPIPDNANHADIIGWAHEKDRYKLQALQLAAEARFVAFPKAE